MIYFKLIGAVLILLCGTLSGFYLSYRLRLRLKVYEDLIDFLSRLHTNIRYFSDDIFKLIKISAPSSLAEFFNRNISLFGIYWESIIKDISKSCGLTADDYNNLIEFGRILGTTDVQGQLSHINIYKGIFTTTRDEYQKDFKTKSKLYRVLGFFLSAAVALLII